MATRGSCGGDRVSEAGQGTVRTGRTYRRRIPAAGGHRRSAALRWCSCSGGTTAPHSGTRMTCRRSSGPHCKEARGGGVNARLKRLGGGTHKLEQPPDEAAWVTQLRMHGVMPAGAPEGSTILDELLWALTSRTKATAARATQARRRVESMTFRALFVWVLEDVKRGRRKRRRWAEEKSRDYIGASWTYSSWIETFQFHHLLVHFNFTSILYVQRHASVTR